MGKINMGRVILGGIAAGIVINIGETLANMVLFADMMAGFLEEYSLPEPGASAITGFVILGFVVGITTVWLYAAIRPRYGPGPGTAVCAGLFVWALYYAFPAVGMALMGMAELGAMVWLIAWGAIEIVAGALVGGMLYQEEAATTAAA